MRLVSMLPSATEIVYALGLGRSAGGRDVRVRRAPVCPGRQDGGGRWPGYPGDVAREINEYVRGRLAQAGICTRCTSGRWQSFSPT